MLEFAASWLINESKGSLRRLISSGRIRVNGRDASGGRTLWTGDVVGLPAGLSVTPLPAPALDLDVLHEDAHHLCVNKPAGFPVLPDRSGGGGEFYRSLLAHVNRDLPADGPYRRPHLVHRLDRDTSG
ncbi:MAG: hypothetical protein AMK73_09710, partial [Planctomycetes bacterium SM23_32]